MSATDRTRARGAPRLCRVAGRAQWYILHAGRRLSTGAQDRASAELALARYLTEADRPQQAVVGINVILDRYLTDRRARAIPGADRLGWAHKPLARFFGEKPPEAIGEAATLAYAARRRADGVVDGTIRTELQALRAALRWALKEGLSTMVPVIAMPARAEARIRWLTREEAAALLDNATAPHLKLFILIGLHTAARTSAILGLTWDRVDLIAGTIDFRAPGRARTRKRRTQVPINATLAEALTAARAACVTEYVIEWGGSGVLRIVHGFRSATAKAKLFGVTPHVLRHTAVTWALREGKDPWAIAQFAGMTLEVLQEVYGHHDPAHLREVAKSLG
jgi:integrase